MSRKPQVLFKLAPTDGSPKPPILYSSWSPNGQQIAVVATGVNGRTDIFLGNSTGTVWTNITKSSESEWEISWSPDGQSIAFTTKSENPDDPIKVFSISPSGENRKQLLQLTNIHSPSWSPDGKRIGFMHSDDQGYYQIYIANPDGSNLKQLTNRTKNHLEPRFSPDGQWIMYRRETRSVEMVSDLYLIRPDGTGDKAVTQDDLAWKGGQAWSPNGEWISFVSMTQENSGEYRIRSAIYLMRPDGTDLTKVTQSDEDVFEPAWRVISP
jgi:TolB protein